MSGWWITPEIPSGHVIVFAVLLILSVSVQVLVSPRRRGLMGPVKFALAAAIEYGIPIFGVIVVRAGFRHAYEAAGWNFWAAIFLSVGWMIAFVTVARLVAWFVPPLSWLMADWRRARREGFKMMVGLGGAPKAAAGPRFVGGSSTAGDGALHRFRPPPAP